MSVITACEYTCQFCHAVHDMFAALEIANKAASAASRGDHEKAKTIIFENRL